MKRSFILSLTAGILAGSLNGLLGTGGGLVLLPLLSRSGLTDEKMLFPACVCCMLPISVLTFLLSGAAASLSWQTAAPYLLGSLLGGLVSVKIRLSPAWMHRGLGLLMLAGGIRSLW